MPFLTHLYTFKKSNNKKITLKYFQTLVLIIFRHALKKYTYFCVD